MRQTLELFANLRPCKSIPHESSRPNIDLIIVRENSEGEYAGIGGRNLAGRGPGREVAVQAALFTEQGCERIIRYAGVNGYTVASTTSRS